MPQHYVKKTNRSYDATSTHAALKDVLDNKLGLRQAAEKYGISKSRLGRLAKAAKEEGLPSIIKNLIPNFKKSRVISEEMENMLATYLLKCSAMFHGLSPSASRRLVYEFAQVNKMRMPNSWEVNQKAGEAWFTDFIKRHQDLSIRTPEATSLARITAFNKHTISVFFDKLHDVLQRVGFSPNNIYNLDETGVTTVPKVQKILAKKGLKQVGQVTSAERGESITQVGIICANGNALPPIWVFPRVRFDEARMMAGAPPGALGLVNKSGWMTSENFIHVLRFIQQTVRCSKENKIVLILDNHESHLSVEGINFCRDHGLILLTLPPHTSNKTQPLDRCVFGPFKKFYSDGVNAWMLSNPNQVLSIYNLPKLCSQAWDRAATPENIKAGFRACGISPYDRNIFKEEEFLSSYVSDRPDPTVVREDTPDGGNTANIARSSGENATDVSGPSGTNMADMAGPSATPPLTPLPKTLPSSTVSIVSPEEIRPYPKAQPRKPSNRGRKRGRCMVATDSPEKLELEERKNRKKKPIPRCRQVFNSSSDEESLIVDGRHWKKGGKAFEQSLPSSSSSGEEWAEESSGEEIDESAFFEHYNNVEIQDWVLVEFMARKGKLYYLGLVTAVVDGEITVKFLKKKSKAYVWPDVEDACVVRLPDVKKKLPPPRIRRGYYSWSGLKFPMSLNLV